SRHLPAPEERGRDRGRGRRARRAGGSGREDLRALLHPSPAPGVRTELGSRPVDLPADHRGPRRPHLGGEPLFRRDRRGWRTRAARRTFHRAAAGNVMAAAAASVHASAVLAGARAVLIRGPAGAGKSRLALALIAAAQTGLLRFARLVGDDRVYLEPFHGRLLVRPAAKLAGLLEVRGLGIRQLEHEPVAGVGLAGVPPPPGAPGVAAAGAGAGCRLPPPPGCGPPPGGPPPRPAP